MAKEQNQGTAKYSDLQFITKMLVLHQDVYSKQEIERIFQIDKRILQNKTTVSHKQKRKQQLVNQLDDYFAIADWYRMLNTNKTLVELGKNLQKLLLLQQELGEENQIDIYAKDKWDFSEEGIVYIPKNRLTELEELHMIHCIDEETRTYALTTFFSEFLELDLFTADEEIAQIEMLRFFFYCLQHPFSVYGYWLLQKIQLLLPEQKLLPTLEIQYLTPSLALSQGVISHPHLQEAIETNQALNFTYRQIKKQGEEAVKISKYHFWPLHVLIDQRTGRVYLFGAEKDGEHFKYAEPIIAESIDLKTLQLVPKTQQQNLSSLRQQHKAAFETSFLYPNMNNNDQSEPELYALKFCTPQGREKSEYRKFVDYQLGERVIPQAFAQQCQLLQQQCELNEDEFLIFGVCDDVMRIIPWIRSFGRHCQIIAGEKLRRKFIEGIEELRICKN